MEHYDIEPVNVVDFAYQIIKLDKENANLKDENEYLKDYEKKYFKLLDDNIKHNSAMMGNLLSAALTMDKVQIEDAFDDNKISHDNDEEV